MSHRRDEIRTAVKAALMGNTSCGDRVFANRALPLFDIPLPAINIITGEETNRSKRALNHFASRDLEVAIDIYCEASEGLDELLDQFAKEVEAILSDKTKFGDVVIDSTQTGTTPDITVLGEQPAGVIRVDFLVTYIDT